MKSPIQSTGLRIEEVNSIKVFAAQGEPSAIFILGCMYDYGLGVTSNHTEAVKLIRKAAEQGNLDAQLRLDFIYKYGHGVPKDRNEALKWRRMATLQRRREPLAAGGAAA